MKIPINLPLADIVPGPELFDHPSTIHGQAHVARVMVHAFRLIEATGWHDEAVRLWACVFCHDLARKNDDADISHGEAAARKLLTPISDPLSLANRLRNSGVLATDYAAIVRAVTMHCKRDDWTMDRLLTLLKDSDGLDRVRLGDLDPGRLRTPEARAMVPFAYDLFNETDGKDGDGFSVIPAGPGHFAALVDVVNRLTGAAVYDHRNPDQGGCALHALERDGSQDRTTPSNGEAL